MRKVFPKEGDTRLVKRFLVGWKTINDEARCLEFATWQEMYERICTDGEKSKEFYCAWQPVKWMNY